MNESPKLLKGERQSDLPCNWLSLARSSQPGQRFKFTHSRGWNGVVILERVTEDSAIFCGFRNGVKDPHEMCADLGRFKELSSFEKC